MPTTSLHGALISQNASVPVLNPLRVVCAFPVSGQYGPGSRILYYVLISACVFARRKEWLRNACLAAALLFPAVAAIHGIVLAAIHQIDAVDMDVYGAFQLCAIGILAAPVTVKISTTYFYDPGRNAIFLWTGLVLAGLLSLTVEFFRIQTFPCPYDNSGKPVSLNPGHFNYTNTCNLTCDVNSGPYSPLRRGSANNIYVIPAPDRLSFGMATLLAAACCIPAILSLASMWNKIREINWKSRFGARNEDEPVDEEIVGTNGATVQKMKGVNKVIRLFLSAVEVPVFTAAVLFILITGERNFWSGQVYYQTEPIASVGQWAPIAGTVLAVIGSLYLLLAAAAGENEPSLNDSMRPCNCSKHEGRNGLFTTPSQHASTPGTPDVERISSDGRERIYSETGSTITRRPTDQGNRLKVARALTAIGHHLGTAPKGQFDMSHFKQGKALDFPEIPGEDYRNSALPQIREQYNQPRDEDGNVTPFHRPASRTSSFHSFEEMPRAVSPRRRHANTMPIERTSSELRNPSSSSTGLNGNSLGRRDTLEVPSAAHHSHTRNNPSASSTSSMLQRQRSPTIVVSSDLDGSSLTQSPDLNSATIPPSESISTPPTAVLPPMSWLGHRPSP